MTMWHDYSEGPTETKGVKNPQEAFSEWWHKPIPMSVAALTGEMSMREYLEMAFLAGYEQGYETGQKDQIKTDKALAELRRKLSDG